MCIYIYTAARGERECAREVNRRAFSCLRCDTKVPLRVSLRRLALRPLLLFPVYTKARATSTSPQDIPFPFLALYPFVVFLSRGEKPTVLEYLRMPSAARVFGQCVSCARAAAMELAGFPRVFGPSGRAGIFFVGARELRVWGFFRGMCMCNWGDGRLESWFVYKEGFFFGCVTCFWRGFFWERVFW